VEQRPRTKDQKLGALPRWRSNFEVQSPRSLGLWSLVILTEIRLILGNGLLQELLQLIGLGFKKRRTELTTDHTEHTDEEKQTTDQRPVECQGPRVKISEVRRSEVGYRRNIFLTPCFCLKSGDCQKNGGKKINLELDKAVQPHRTQRTQS